jgi:hypothetical protein
VISKKNQVHFAAILGTALLWTNECYAAVDSYRYLHVTVETPYTIFLFLLAGILAPFLLMGILVWRFIGRKPKAEDEQQIPAGLSNHEDHGQ